MSNCFLSHQISYLAGELGDHIYRKTEISRKIIVTNHNAQKEYLTSFFTHKYGISMGIHWFDLCGIIEHIFCISGQNCYKFANVSLLTLHIEQEIKAYLTQNNPIFSPLREYLGTNFPSIRLYKIANYLASLFLLYGNVESSKLLQWLKKKEWQQELFTRLMSYWEIPFNFRNRGTFELPFPIEIHFFHCSYISETLLDFFQNNITGLTCYFYLFSPTSLYWGDLYSDRKISYLSRNYIKRKIPSKYILAVDNYMKKNNIFLSNLTEFGQPLFNYAIEMNWEIKENFFAENRGTLLHNLQRDLIAHTNENFDSDYRINGWDDSIQVHKVTSIMQELEVVYMILGKIIEIDPKLGPDDIMIVAPDIAKYTPLIPFVFAKANNSLPYIIENSGKSNELFEGIIQILQLVGSALDVSRLRAFFALHLVQKKFSLSQEEIQDFFLLVEKMNVSWGFNLDHRIKILKTSPKNSEVDEIGTWEYFFDRIIYGFCMAVDCQDENFEEQQKEIDYRFFPSCNLSFTKAPWIGTFYTILQNIYQNICGRDTDEMPMEEWIQLLFHWIDMLLMQNFYSSDEYAQLQKYLCNIYKLPLTCRTNPISFLSFHQFLHSFLRESPSRSDRIGRICFSSLEQGKIPPSTILCVLGFDEESFPRRQRENSLNDLQVDQMELPKGTLQDRYCFLEILHQAKDKLLFFFHAFDAADGKERGYSHLISELFTYLDSIMAIDSRRQCFIDHDVISRLGMKKVLLLTYDNTSAHRFDVCFPVREDISMQGNFHITNLYRLARNPLYTYFQVQFGVFWKPVQAPYQYHLTISNLDRFIIKNSLFRHSSLHILEVQQILGKLPSGAFKRLASQIILLEEKKIAANLPKIQKPIFSVYIHPNITNSIQLMDTWFIPSKVAKDIGNIILEGELHNVSLSGLICQGTMEIHNLCREWPRIVLFMSIVQKHCNCLAEIIFVEDKKKWNIPNICWEEALREYITYYRIAGHNISPLHSTWMPLFLSDQKDKWCHIVTSSQIDLGNNFQWVKDIFLRVAPLPIVYQKWYEYVQTKLPCFIQGCRENHENI